MQSVNKELNLSAINTPLMDPAYSINSAMNLVKAGFVAEGLTELEKISLNDPRNLDALNSLALIYDQTNLIDRSVTIREKISILDPWNAANYLALGKNYKARGNVTKSKEMLDKILSFASSNPIANQANEELLI
jgi:tetratricopeptide (TPR) repeat protein